MNRIKFITLLALPLFISNISFAGDRVVARCNGHNILKSEVAERFKSPSGKLPEGKSDLDDYSPEIKQKLIGEFVQEKLLTTAAEKANITRDPAYKKQLENCIKQSKIKIYLEKYTDKRLTPAMIREAYNQYVADLKESDELKISHILVKTEAEANKLAAELKSKKIKFDDAAKKYSIDKMSKNNGGEIGFINRGQTVPEFEDTAYSLSKGSVSAPVKTDFGWHIIKLLDSRERKIPSFNDIKQNIEDRVRMGLMQKHITDLAQNAKVEIFPKKK
jgi:peptidyl-prolyl cis-trans isomerase C